MKDTHMKDFDYWWQLEGEWVEEPNQRRNGWSGMMRTRVGEEVFYVKKQCNHLYRSLRHPFGWPTTCREHQNIQRLLALGIKVPEPVFNGIGCAEEGFRGLLVTKELTGYVPLDTQTALTTEQRAQLAKAVGQVIGRMHQAHWQHSCLYDKHIFVRWQNGKPDVALIDLEKLRRPVLFWRAAAHDLDQLSRHQAIWSDEEWTLLLTAHGEATAG